MVRGMMSVIRPWIPAVLVLALAAAALLMPGTKANPPYQFLFDRTQATDDQQRFLNTVVQQSGVSRDQLEPLLPRIRRVTTDLPMLLELSRVSGRPLPDVVEMRRSGKSWQRVREAFDLPVKGLFTDVTGRFPDPYKEAWVEWRMKRKPELSDDQVQELTVLDLAHRLTGKPKEVIVKERARGRTPEQMIAQLKLPPKTDDAEASPTPKPDTAKSKATLQTGRNRPSVRRASGTPRAIAPAK